MAYNIRGKTLSTVIPASLYSKYPNFITFLDKYYEWSRKTVLEMGSYEGNLNLSSKFYGMKSDFYVNKEVINTLNKSYNVDFSGQRTFLPTEKVIGIRPLTNPLTLTIGIDRDYLIEKISNPKLTFYYDQQYKIENSTGATLYIKDQQTGGSGNQYTTNVDPSPSVSDGATVTITTTSATPRLYYTVDGYDGIGIIDVEAIPAEFTYRVLNIINTDLPDNSGYTNSVYGFGRIHNILFNPDYLVDSYDTLTTIDAPDAFFLKYLESYGLGDIFSETIRNRSSTDDFIRFLNSKGTPGATKFFFRAFFNKDVELDYPGLNMIKSSDGDYFVKQKMIIKSTKSLELTRNRRLKGNTSGAYVTIESVQYNSANDYYEVFIDKDTIDGLFLIDEGILVIDNTDASIEYDIEGTILGIYYKADIIQAGIEYDKGEVISNSYSIEGTSKIIGFTVDDITTTGIEDTTITSGGTNYVIGDRLFFPKPTERVTFSATIDSSQASPIVFSGPNNEYTYSSSVLPSIKITLEDDAKNTALFTTTSETYNDAKVEINGTKYTAIDIVEGSPDVLTLPAVDANGLTIRSGQTIIITVNENLIVDILTDTSFFDTSIGVTNTPSVGYVSRVNASTGAIEEVKIDNFGAGYRKQPTTTSGITIITDGKTLTHPSLLSNSGSNNTVTHPTHNSITHSTQDDFIVGEEVIGDISGASGTIIKEASITSLQVTGVTEGNQFLSGSQILEHDDPDPEFVAGRTLTGQVSGAVGTVVAIPAPSETHTTVSNVVGGPFLNEPTITGTTGGGVAFVVGETITQATSLAKGRVTGTYGSAATTANASGGVISYTTLSGTFADNNAITGATSSATLGASATLLYSTGEIVTESSGGNTAILSTANPLVRDTITGQISGATATVSAVVGSFGKGETVTGTNVVLTISGGTTFPVGNQLNQGILTHADHSGSAFTVGETLTQASTSATGVVIASTVDVTHFKDLVTGTWGTSNNVTGGTSSVTLSSSHLTAVTVGKGIVAYSDSTFTVLKDVIGAFANSAGLDDYNTVARENATISANVVGSTGVVQSHDGLQTLITNGSLPVGAAIVDVAGTPATATIVSVDGDEYELTHTAHSGVAFTVGSTITQGSATGTVLAGGDADKTLFKNLGTATWVTGTDVTQSSPSSVTLANAHLTRVTFRSGTSFLTHPGGGTFTVGETITQGTATGTVQSGSSNDETIFKDLNTAAWGTGTDTVGGTSAVTVTAANTDAVVIGSSTIVIKEASKIFSVGNVTATGQTVAARTITATINETMLVTPATGRFVVGDIITGGTTGAVTKLSTINSLFTVGETVTQASSGATGKVVSTADTRMTATNVSGTFNTSNIVTGALSNMTTTPSAITTGASANLSSTGEDFGGAKGVSITTDVIGITNDVTINLTRSDVADSTNNNTEIILRAGYYRDYGKLFNDVTGYLSETSMKITDSYRYQDFSYSIKSDLNYKDFAVLLKKLAHPAGMIFFNDFFIVNSFQQKLNKGVATAIKEIRINIHKTSVTKLAHAAQTFTKGRKITGGTSGATGKVAIAHHKLLTTLDVVRGTFVAGETLTEYTDADYLIYELTHAAHSAAAFPLGTTISQVTTNASGIVLDGGDADKTLVKDLGLGTWGTATNVVAARVLNHQSHTGNSFAVGETITQAASGTDPTGYVISSTVNETIFRDLGTATWNATDSVTGGTSGFTLTSSNLATVSSAGITLSSSHLTASTLTNKTAVVASSGVNDIDKLHLIFSASSLSAIKDFFVNYHAQRPFDDQFQWLNESLVSFSNYISSGSDAYNNSNLISTYVDVPINEKSIVKRDGVRGIPFQSLRQTENVKTVAGAGTVAFADTTTVSSTGPPGPVITVTGSSSNFINQCSPRDIITAGAHTLLVVAVASDTSLTAQRTSVAGSIDVTGQSYTVAQKRINELNNATFDDFIQHAGLVLADIMTIQEVNNQFLSGSELTMDQFQDVFAV